ncbi:MAG: RNA polymerase sigma factor [Clostridia bacterium]
MENRYNLTEYVDKLFSKALRKTGDPVLAEDLTQETFLAAIQGLARGRQPDNLWAWLSQILSNKYCDWLREKYNKPQISLEDYPYEIPEDTSAQDADTTEIREAIRREIGYLAGIHREVLVRFYLHGHSIGKIAKDLQIPVGTVKSRLDTGRQQIRKGVDEMENYTKQSYEPEVLRIACSGKPGIDNEPFSLVENNDKLTQNILILAYPTPLSETELSKSLGVPLPFLEPIIKRLLEGELMKRTKGGKVYTDFILYHEKDRNATFQKQLALADRSFALFWNILEEALSELRGSDYYKRQSAHAASKLELHFCLDLLSGGCIRIRDEFAGSASSYSDYPYRPNGGKWVAMGNRYESDRALKENENFRKYSINGEWGILIKNFRDAKSLELRKYDTSLGSLPYPFEETHIQWLYEILSGVSYERASVADHVLQSAEAFLKSGILKKETGLALDIPVLSKAEYYSEKELSGAKQRTFCAAAQNIMHALFQESVRLPSHLKHIPKWQQLLYCGDRIPMAVIYQAMEKGLLFRGVDYPLPAAIFVIDQ